MLQVDLDHILSSDNAAAHILDLFTHVSQQKERYAITVGGVPSVVIIPIEEAENLPVSGMAFPVVEEPVIGQPLAADFVTPAAEVVATPEPAVVPTPELTMSDLPALPQLPDMPLDTTP